VNKPRSPEAQAAIEEAARQADVTVEQFAAALVEATEKAMAVLTAIFATLKWSDGFTELVQRAQEYEAANNRPDRGDSD